MKRTALTIAALMLGLSMARENVTPEGTGWIYRWGVSPEEASQLWRQPAHDSETAWVDAGSIDQEVVEVATTAAQPDVAVARTTQALFRTEDGGKSWQEMSGLPDWPTAMALGQKKTGLIYLGTLTGGVFRSDDGGATWQHLPLELEIMSGPFLEITALAVHPEDDEIVYAAAGHWLGSTQMVFSPSGIALSLDGGKSWQVAHEAELNDERIVSLEPDSKQPLQVLGHTEQPTR